MHPESCTGPSLSSPFLTRMVVTQLRLTLCDPMDCSMPGSPVFHYFLELAQTHVRGVSDAVQPSHPLSSPSLALIFPSIRVFSDESALHTLNLSQRQGLFRRVGSSHQRVSSAFPPSIWKILFSIGSSWFKVGVKCGPNFTFFLNAVHLLQHP